MEGYSESTEPIDAVNILPLERFEPTTLATPPSTTQDTDATNFTTETSPKKYVQEALIHVETKSLLQHELLKPEFYGDLVYKLKKIVGTNTFIVQFQRSLLK